MLLKLSVLLIINFSKLINGNDNLTPEDAHLTTPELIVKYGYPCEIHHVTTSDGYILEMHRIPHGKTNNISSSKIPVLLGHGIGGSSAASVVQGPEKSLGYILADAGYDVWINNARGTRYSRKHISLDADTDKSYWKFSWHEIGVYDLPANIDYILSITGYENLFYIGHSQGGTVFYVMASEKPEYNAKIRAHFSLAPAVYMQHAANPILQILGPLSILLDTATDITQLYDLSSVELLQMATPAFCNVDATTRLLCANVMFLLFGFDIPEMNMTMVPVYFGHFPAGFATYQLLHYIQEVNSGRFCQFDYGIEQNVIKYKSVSPPRYKLENVIAPVYIFYSSNDLLVSPIDIERLSSELPTSPILQLVDNPLWSHGDYIFGIDEKSLVYDFVIIGMQNH